MTAENQWYFHQHLAKKRAEKWNAAHPVGTPVKVRRDDGTYFETKTRSEAQLLLCNIPVIWLEGITGCYRLDRIEAL